MSNLNALWNVWNAHSELKIKGTQYTIKGFSIAALRTNFFIKELNIMLDAGISSNSNPDYIFVTHTHSDHSANLPFHLYSPNKVSIYVPEESLNKFSKFVESAHKLNTQTDDEEYHRADCYSFIGVKPKERSTLLLNGTKIELEVIQCYHSVPCVGYGFTEKKSS